MDEEIKRFEWLLTKIQLLDAPFRVSAEGKGLYEEICKLVFEDQLYVRLWSEPALKQLEHLFQIEKPDEELFQSELTEIGERTRTVKEVNDFFSPLSTQTLPERRSASYWQNSKVFRRTFTSD